MSRRLALAGAASLYAFAALASSTAGPGSPTAAPTGPAGGDLSFDLPQSNRRQGQRQYAGRDMLGGPIRQHDR